MKKVIAMLAAVAVTSGVSHAVVLDEAVVDGGPLNVVLNGTITGNDGAKVKLVAIPLTYVATSVTSVSGGGVTNTVTQATLASSVTTSNVIDGATTNTIVTGVSGTIFNTDDNTGVEITKGSSGEAADVFYQDSSVSGTNAPVNAVLYIDAKLKVDKKTGDTTGVSAKVYGIWQKGQGIISGTLKPAK